MCLRKALLWIISLLLIVILGGCWSAFEINDRSFARILLVDKTSEGIELSIGFPLPNRLSSRTAGSGGGESNGNPFTFITKSGADIPEAYRKIQADLTRKITFGQLRHIVIGKSLAEESILPIVDFTSRQAEIHINSYVFVTDGDVKQLFDVPVTFEQFPSDILSKYARDQIAVTTTIKDLLMDAYSGGDFILPKLVFGYSGVQREKDAQHWMGTDGAAVFRQGRMIGSLNTNEERGALWILKQMQSTETDVKSPEDGKRINILIEDARIKIQPHLRGEHVDVDIYCKANGRIIGTESVLDVTNPERLKRVEERLNQRVEERITLVLNASKRLRSDFFNISNYVKWSYPKVWRNHQKDWRSYYVSRVRLHPHSHVNIKWFGGTQKPDWNKLLKEEPRK